MAMPLLARFAVSRAPTFGLAGMEQPGQGLCQCPGGLGGFDFHDLVDRPQLILFRQHFLQAGGKAAAEAEVGSVFRIAVIGIFGAPLVEQVEQPGGRRSEMPT